jgi:hypothetical protein
MKSEKLHYHRFSQSTSEDDLARSTFREIEETEEGKIYELHVEVDASDVFGAQPNRWMIVWVDYEKVIAENLEPYLRKYCPEPEKVLELLPPVFRPRINAAADATEVLIEELEKVDKEWAED